MDISTFIRVVQCPPREIGEDKIRSYLATKARVALLYESIRAFLGNTLHVLPAILGMESSCTFYGLIPKPANISLFLDTNDNNIPAALAHELLHIKMAVDGFPVRCIPDPEITDATVFRHRIRINNGLGHLVFHDEFLAMGFRSEEFVADFAREGDPSEGKRAALEDLRLGRPFVRGHWLTWYLTELISHQFGWPNRANGVLEAGRQLFPDRMDADSKWIRIWLARSDFRSPYRYLSSVNELFSRLEFPLAKMERLNRSSTGLEFIAAS
jgi:hypothetical protein